MIVKAACRGAPMAQWLWGRDSLGWKCLAWNRTDIRSGRWIMFPYFCVLWVAKYCPSSFWDSWFDDVRNAVRCCASQSQLWLVILHDTIQQDVWLYHCLLAAFQGYIMLHVVIQLFFHPMIFRVNGHPKTGLIFAGLNPQPCWLWVFVLYICISMLWLPMQWFSGGYSLCIKYVQSAKILCLSWQYFIDFHSTSCS